jgi:hypothetical protein
MPAEQGEDHGDGPAKAARTSTAKPGRRQREGSAYEQAWLVAGPRLHDHRDFYFVAVITRADMSQFVTTNEVKVYRAK